MKKLLAVVLSLALALTGLVVPEIKAITVQAAEIKEEYSLDIKMIEPNGYYELCTGDEVCATGELKTSDGTSLDGKTWEVLTDNEMEETLNAQNKPLCFYSEYDNVKDALSDMVAFSGTVPVEAFGKYIYKYFGAYLISDPTIITYTLIRSENTVTSWGDTDYLTFSLNNDKKTVTVYSIWKCGSAHFPTEAYVGDKTYKVTAIGDYALEDKEIKSTTIPSTITSVGKGAFSKINKNAVIEIKASKSNYEKIVMRIKNSGVPKTVKFKRV